MKDEHRDQVFHCLSLLQNNRENGICTWGQHGNWTYIKAENMYTKQFWGVKFNGKIHFVICLKCSPFGDVIS